MELDGPAALVVNDGVLAAIAIDVGARRDEVGGIPGASLLEDFLAPLRGT
jgi:hypothetical protein